MTRCSPRRPSRAATATTSRRRPAVEWRRWLCVTTRAGVDVCTAHLATRSTARGRNDAQCAELAALLDRRAATQTVIFGGDVNRSRACAPERAWTRSDGSADQAPGLQSASGIGALRSPSAQVLPARHTDHDFLMVRAHRLDEGSRRRRGSTGAVASTTMPSGVSSPDRCSRSMSRVSDRRPPHSSSGRASSSPGAACRRSTSRTKTPSNRSMKSGWFREPPQKNVSASAWSATRALTLSTCQTWSSCVRPSTASSRSPWMAW